MLSAARALRPARFPGLSTVRGPSILAFVLLIAFFLQGLVAQTHIHGVRPVGSPAIGSISIAVAGPSDESGLPSDDDEAHCLLCQAGVLANGLSVPIAVGLPMVIRILLGVMTIRSPPIFIVRPIGHASRQRAPPTP